MIKGYLSFCVVALVVFFFVASLFSLGSGDTTSLLIIMLVTGIIIAKWAYSFYKGRKTGEFNIDDRKRRAIDCSGCSRQFEKENGRDCISCDKYRAYEAKEEAWNRGIRDTLELEQIGEKANEDYWGEIKKSNDRFKETEKQREKYK